MKRAERGVNVVTLYVIGIFLLVALLLGYLLYAFRAEMIRKENRETLATQMTALVSNVDAQLVEMFERQIPQRIASRDVAVESLKHLAEASQPGTGEIRAVVQLLGEIKSAYALPDEVEIWFPGPRILAGTRGVRFPEDKKYRPAGLDPYWEQLGLRDSAWVFHTEGKGPGARRYISFLKRYPGVFGQAEEPILILSCPEESFLPRIRSCLRGLQPEDVLMLVSGDTVLIAEAEGLTGISASTLLSGSEVLLPDGRSGLSVCGYPAMQDLSLLLVRTDLRSGPEAADLAWMLLALFLVVLGFALVLYLQNRHYTLPLTRLMHRLNLETAVPGQRLYRPDRTISLMENRLEDIHEQHLEKEQEIEQSRQQLRSAWLNCLIFDETTWAHPLPALEIDFPYSHLLCLMFSAVPSGEEMKILSEALLPLPCQMEIFENAHREWVALLNLEATQAERVPFLLQSVVAALPDADLAFGVGLPVERTAPVGVSYRCARRALTERYFSRDQRVCVFHTETAHASNEQVMSTILAQVGAMPRRAAAMKTEEALELSEAIVSALKSLIPYMGTIRSVMLLTGAFFLQTAYDFKASPQEVYGDDLMRIYYHLENINGYRERMRQDCLSLAEYMRQQNSSSLHGLVQLALEVISRTPPSALSTQTVADALGISTGHLSRIFHQETGEKLVDCLQRKKMDCAARLLREGDYSNEKICELIGYSRVQYFAAKFREYSGLSPSEYRRTYGLAGE